MKIKKDLKFAIIIAIIVAVVSITPIVSASDWEQFQKDEINSGWTTDCAPIYEPTLAWSYDIITPDPSWAGFDVVPIVGDGAVYVLDYEGNLWSFDAKTGTVNWGGPTDLTEGDGQFEISTPAYNNNIVYAAVSSGRDGEGAGRVCGVYASGVNEGEIRNDKYYGLDTFQLNTPITYADDKIYIGNWKGGITHTEDNGTYYCIDAGDVDTEIWSRTAPYVTGYYWAGAAIIEDYIVYGDDSSIVTCRYKDNGTFVDSINVADTYGIAAGEIRSSIAWNDEYNRVYFSSKGGYAFAIGFDQESGMFNTYNDWNIPYPIGYSTSTPVVYDDRVYVGQGPHGPTGKVYCLDEADGSQEWVTGNLGGVQSSMALSVVNGRKFIYFTINNANGSAYCIEDLGNDQYNIEWEWNPPLDDNFVLQGMAISEGMVYFGTDDGILYALEECGGLCGDANRDGSVNMMDTGAVFGYIFHPGSVTICNPWAADVNCLGGIDMMDAGAIMGHIFQGVTLNSCCQGC